LKSASPLRHVSRSSVAVITLSPPALRHPLSPENPLTQSTDPTDPTDPSRLDPQTLDYTTPETARAAEREDPHPWFGYIGLAIPIAAMLVGFAALILFVLYFLNG